MNATEPGSSHSALVAQVYDLDKPIGLSYGDVEYYTEALRDVDGPILELACGNGRVLVPMLAAGLEMAGLDHSADMVERCRGNARARGFDPELIVADMADFSTAHPFAAITVPSGSFKDLPGPDALAAALASCRRALRPGGILILDIAPPTLIESRTGELKVWRLDEVIWTQQCVHLDFDASRTRTTEYLRYEKYVDHVLVRTELHAFCIQHRPVEEVRAALVAADFTGIAVNANYEPGRPPGPHDEDWTFHARRG